jgi:hypothetical protein
MSIEQKIKDIELSYLKKTVAKLLSNVLDGFNQVMEQDTFNYSYDKIGYLLYERFKGLMLGDVNKVFENIEMGEYGIKKISVSSVMEAFKHFRTWKHEQQRQVQERNEQEWKGQTANLHKTPYGSAIIRKMEALEKLKDNPNMVLERKISEMPIQELAEKIVSKEIDFNYKPPRKARF